MSKYDEIEKGIDQTIEILNRNNQITKCSVGDIIYIILNVKRKGVINKEVWDYTVKAINKEPDEDSEPWNIYMEHIESDGVIYPSWCSWEQVSNMLFDQRIFTTKEEAIKKIATVK